jgi:hypothetical protein
MDFLIQARNDEAFHQIRSYLNDITTENKVVNSHELPEILQVEHRKSSSFNLARCRRFASRACGRDSSRPVYFDRSRYRVRVLDLDPVRRPASAVWAIAALRYQALEVHFTGCPK